MVKNNNINKSKGVFKMKEKEFLIFIGDRRVFCDSVEDLREQIRGLKSWEYVIYKIYEGLK